MVLGIQLAALIICACAVSSQNVTKIDYQSTISRFEQICDMFAKDSFFSIDLIADKTWRIYYSWNIDMFDRCMDMTFKKATAASVNRIWSDMHEYLETEPAWEAAAFLMTMGKSDHEMMLFADQGPAGRMLGVPNIRRDSNVLIPKKSVPLLKFQMKILNINTLKFLVMMDCNVGVTTLSLPINEEPPFTIFLDAAALYVPWGAGSLACWEHHNVNEDHFNRDYRLL